MYVTGFLTEANSGAHHTESESVRVTRELIKNVHVYNYPDLVLRVTCATESMNPIYAGNSCWHLIPKSTNHISKQQNRKIVIFIQR